MAVSSIINDRRYRACDIGWVLVFFNRNYKTTFILVHKHFGFFAHHYVFLKAKLDLTCISFLVISEENHRFSKSFIPWPQARISGSCVMHGRTCHVRNTATFAERIYPQDSCHAAEDARICLLNPSRKNKG